VLERLQVRKYTIKAVDDMNGKMKIVPKMKGEHINYKTNKGHLNAKVEDWVQLGKWIVYRVDNGDYVAQTETGYLRTFKTIALNKLFTK
jgi:GTP-dependent phosphoenolpyruvate carboxykinase